ncbi:unnamed protein product [Didymodactylos carnosus]|uniref:Tetratricopeptide repeat protein n=1 Tax=Didymodactylos carnosus TaxID=1234261 RepID=A0A814VZL2_9BILA|nr:unnamed protein product [Didymodactylos carnosus]CAF1195588.1 unnamed protein product [Didymodactylos carnosus]CAF3837414.1 unnamed protein product [Didymodactylos carnosus]CAF3960012.1 unnamed protein product [Didymodactylos carnosus]
MINCPVGFVLCIISSVYTLSTFGWWFAGVKYHNNNNDKIPVIFEINIDQISNKAYFTNIKEYSSKKDEDEILFSIDTIFQILSIEDYGNCCFIVLKLTTYDDTNPEWKKLYDHLERQINKNVPLFTMARFFYASCDFDKAEQYYQLLLDDDPNNKYLISVIYGDHRLALSYVKEARNLLNISHLPSTHPSYATYYNNKAVSQAGLGENSKALKSFIRAYEIQKYSVTKNHLDFVSLLTNIGSQYFKLNKNHLASNYFQSAIDIQQLYLSIDDNEFISLYYIMGEILLKQGKLTDSLKYYKQALNCHLKILPLTVVYEHRSISLNDAKFKYSYFTYFLQKFHPYIKITCIPDESKQIALYYNRIGLLYYFLKQYDDSLINQEHAWTICMKSLPWDYRLLAAACSNMGSIFYDIKRFDKAIGYFKKDFYCIIIFIRK